jgi:hypothetical protein
MKGLKTWLAAGCAAGLGVVFCPIIKGDRRHRKGPGNYPMNSMRPKPEVRAQSRSDLLVLNNGKMRP